MKQTLSFLGTARILRRAGILLSSTALCACGMGFDGGTHDLGRTADLLTSTPPDAGTASASSAQPLEDFIGVWQGEAEDPFLVTENGSPGVYHFPSGSTSIQLTIGRNGAAIQFGAGVAPPVTDLERGYPLDARYTSEAQAGAPLLPPLEGFQYIVRAQTAYSVEDLGNLGDILTDGVLRLFYEQNQFVRDWCAAQEPKVGPMQLSGYSCLGAGGYGSDLDACAYMPFDPDADPADTSQMMVPVDCGRLYLCESSNVPICECTADQCTINQTTRSGLFLRVVGDQLVGSFAQGVFARPDGFATPLGVVRFQRVE